MTDVDKLTLHYDRGKISSYDRMPNGSIRVLGTIANVGWLEYRNRDGQSRLEYVSPDVLFSDEHLLSIGGAPLTLDHPSEPVNPKNYKKYAVGSTGTKIIKREDLGLLDIVTIIGDEAAIRAVEDGVNDLSMGYLSESVPADLTKLDSKALNELARYDSVDTRTQIRRVCNHNAIVAQGRATEAKLHLDGWLNVDSPVLTELNLKPVSQTGIKLAGIYF